MCLTSVRKTLDLHGLQGATPRRPDVEVDDEAGGDASTDIDDDDKHEDDE